MKKKTRYPLVGLTLSGASALALAYGCTTTAPLSQNTTPSRARGLSSNPPLFPDDRAVCKESSGTDEFPSVEQMNALNEQMGSLSHRLHHSFWHGVRSEWGSLKPAQRKAFATAYGQAWNQSHPICPAPPTEISADPKAKYLPSGEDFLFIHHGMIEFTRQVLSDHGLPCISGWTSMPDAKSKSFPVPSLDAKAEAWERSTKTDAAFDRMKAWQDHFLSKTWLQGKSLSFVGHALELTLHNNMHMRFAEQSKPSEQPNGDPLELAISNKISSFKFSTSYHWLGDPFSAHTNPYFWKLHGLVDSVLALWLETNGYDSISVDCEAARHDNPGIKNCYAWRGTWVGTIPNVPTPGNKGIHPPSDHDNGHDNSHGPHRAHGETVEVDPDKLKDPALKSAAAQIMKRGMFLKGILEESFLKSVAKKPKAKKPVPGDKAPLPSDEWFDDPAAYLKRCGPCAKPGLCQD